LGHKICILKLGQPYNICIHNKEEREKMEKKKRRKILKIIFLKYKNMLYKIIRELKKMI
jgi:hypothetical protein